MMCSISSPKRCRALIRNRLLSVRLMKELFAKARDAQLDWLIDSNNHIPTQNTALVQPVKKSRIILTFLCLSLPSCRDVHRAVPRQPCTTWSSSQCLCLYCVGVYVSSTCIWVHMCVCFYCLSMALLCCANLIRQQDQPCPEAMG